MDILAASNDDGIVFWYENVSNQLPNIQITSTDGVVDTTTRNQLTFSWTANDEDEGGSVVGYDLQVISPSVTFDSTLTDTSYKTKILEEGVHRFRIRATDNQGAKSAFIDFNFTVINTPPTIEFTSTPAEDTVLTSSNALFSWNSQDVDSASSIAYHQVDVLGPINLSSQITDTLIELTNLIDGDYVFSVFAVDERDSASVTITSNFSVDLAPEKPSNLVEAEPTVYNRVSLQWDRLAVADVDSFTVYRGTDENALDSLDKVLNPTSGFAMYLDETVNSFTSYYYAVSAQDSFGTVSEFSDTLAVQVPRPPFTAPGNFNAISEVGRNALSWIAPPGETIDIAKYHVIVQ